MIIEALFQKKHENKEEKVIKEGMWSKKKFYQWDGKIHMIFCGCWIF